jgi:non-specific serine/threonine protein kinase
MLETIREYGLARLEETGEADAVRRDHAAHFLALCARNGRQWYLPTKNDWLEGVESERRNIDVALRFLVESGDVQRALRLAGALGGFWLIHGPVREGITQMGETLALSDRVSSRDGAREEWRLDRAFALFWIACLSRRQTEYAAARRYAAESLAILRESDERQGLLKTLVQTSNIELQDGNLAAARSQLEEALVFARNMGDQFSLLYALTYLGMIALHEEGYSETRLYLDDALRRSGSTGDYYCRSYAYHALGCAALGEGRLEESREHFKRSRDIALAFHDQPLIAHLIEGFAGIAVAAGFPERAVTLAAAANALRERIGVPLPPVWRRWLDKWLAPAFSTLSAEAIERARAAGEVMTSEQVWESATRLMNCVTYSHPGETRA